MAYPLCMYLLCVFLVHIAYIIRVNLCNVQYKLYRVVNVVLYSMLLERGGPACLLFIGSVGVRPPSPKSSKTWDQIGVFPSCIPVYSVNLSNLFSTEFYPNVKVTVQWYVCRYLIKKNIYTVIYSLIGSANVKFSSPLLLLRVFKFSLC